MEREEIKNKIFNYFKQQALKKHYSHSENQVGKIYDLFKSSSSMLPSSEDCSVALEIVHEFINKGFLHPGTPGAPQNTSQMSLPSFTITQYGKEVFSQENWLPYDPEGYLKELKAQVPEIDSVTLAYIGESIDTFNRRQLLAAIITLGVASENLMLLLIESYINWLQNQDPKRKAKLEKKIQDRFIFTQYKEFKQEFVNDVKNLPKNLQADWETYLEGVFNFIRVNRNLAGHPSGKQLNAKAVYANLQIFADYARYILDLMKYFS